MTAQVTTSEHVLGRARWAARAYQRYPATEVARIVSAVAAAAQTNARRLAESAVAESGRGVVTDRTRTHTACANAAHEFHDGPDLLSPRMNPARALVEIPRPAGVVLSLLPAHSAFAHGCVAALFALMTRNAIVIRCPAGEPSCAEGVRLLATSAVAAGAPDGVIQCLTEQPPPPATDLLTHGRVDLVVATPVPTAEAAPAAGGVPVLVDAAVDPSAVAAQLMDSVSFDNALVGGTESVLVVTDGVAEPVTAELSRRGAAVLDAAAAGQLRRYLFADGTPAPDAAGRDAAWIAHRAGIRVDPATRVLVAPFDLAVPEEPFVRGSRAPVLGIVRVPDVMRGVAAARSVVRARGAGLAAAVHSTDPAVIARFCTEVPVARVVVNAACTTAGRDGDAGLVDAVAAGMTIAGRQSPGLRPEDLLSWTTVTSTGTRPGVIAQLATMESRVAEHGPVPPYPVASNAREGGR
ncbi:acyl-CoA reductase-like NAD-dependent aldehyde dehydrogenase [Pseudonocardia hierapolitana]|uniref:Acyl-CoA reductase-like NAD-dependent aldehyde dehydrogenase n=1 Tax=Pseudonocardia hierapolitana TaxID=1128676 RepID=A0A561SKA1_9PSEU|nr:aldehyde dehydrogenase family protein [Pseudonocardia hierapolitana]TWF75232.1 acyl-CoA reductase-like NAD-dependent aldehyde dehydrogenase [Pseudonocardia hierapolitana]